MIPYRADDTADPTSAIPVVTIALIAANFAAFFYELSLAAQGSELDAFIKAYSLVPCEYTQGCGPLPRHPLSVLDHAVQLDVHARGLGAHPRQHAVPFRFRAPRRTIDGRHSLPR